MSQEARKGALYNYLNLFLIIVAGMFLTPFIVRNLGASQYGLYTLVGAIVPYLMLLDMGMSKTITRYVAHYRTRHDGENEARFLTTAASIYGIITLVLVACGTCLYYGSDYIWSEQFSKEELHEVRQMILVVVAAHVVIIPGNAFTAICNGSGKFAFPRALQPVKYLIRIVCVVALLLYGYRALALIVMEMLLNIGMVIATMLYVRRHIGRTHIFAPTRMPLRPIVQYSGWIALYAATCALQWSGGQIVAGMTFDASTVGVVGIGIMIGNMYGYFAETINRMTLPRATRLIKENASGEAVTQGMIEIGRIIAIVQMCILSTFALFGDTFVQLWAGESYRNAYFIALIMMGTWMVQLTQDYGNALLEAKGRVRTMAIINFIAIFAGVIASYYAAQCWGTIGLIGSLGCGTITATIANNFYYRHRLHLNTREYFVKVYGKLLVNTAIIMSASVVIKHYIANNNSWLWLIVGVITYVGIYIATTYLCVLSKEERKLLKKDAQHNRG